MNIRQIASMNECYSKINREERNYAALFYHALMNKQNAEIFLSKIGCSDPITDEFGIYFEYSFLRDIWYTIKGDEEEKTKKRILREHLKINDIDLILSKSREDINRYFGVMGEPSKDYIQYPGNWAITKYDKNIEDKEDFLAVTKFKWSFNIKPDIVIHINKEKAICIEAKYESGEGQYPSNNKDKEIFLRRNLNPVGQMKLQKYMMTELLGIETSFAFLVYKKEQSDTHKVITWAEAFSDLELNDLPDFAEEMLQNVGRKKII